MIYRKCPHCYCIVKIDLFSFRTTPDRYPVEYFFEDHYANDYVGYSIPLPDEKLCPGTFKTVKLTDEELAFYEIGR